MHDESAITVKEASPSGEWWARTPSFVALFSIERGEGFAAIATRDGDLLFRVEWLYPRSGYWHGRFEYLVSNENHVSTWVGNLGPFWEKWNPWDPLPQAGEGDFEELHVERIEGTFGSDAEPFSLFLSEKHDPAVAHTDDAATFARLRALLAAGKAREPSPGSGR